MTLPIFSFARREIQMLQDRRLDRRIQGAAQIILRELAAAPLACAGVKPLPSHLLRKIYRAETAQGPAAVKIYFGVQAGRPRISPVLVDALARAGVAAPGVIWEEESPRNENGVLCRAVVSQWIDAGAGEPRAESDAAAMQNLRRIHSIERAPGHKIFGEIPKLSAQRALETSARSLHRMAKAGAGIDARTQKILIRKLTGSIAPVFSRATLRLLHCDYSPYNLLRGADGALHTIDWDMLRWGPPEFDLAWAALHFGHGLRSSAIAEAPLGELLAGAARDRIAALYYDGAPAEDKALWEAAGEGCLLWAYIRAAGNAAMHSLDPVRYARAERAALLKVARAQSAQLRAWARA